MNLFDWMEHYKVIETMFITIVMAGSLLMTVMGFKAAWQILFAKRYPITSASSNEMEEELEAMVSRIVDERLRVAEFDTVMVLMEKQRLKKLEIQELQLRLGADDAAQCHLS